MKKFLNIMLLPLILAAALFTTFMPDTWHYRKVGKLVPNSLSIKDTIVYCDANCPGHNYIFCEYQVINPKTYRCYKQSDKFKCKSNGNISDFGKLKLLKKGIYSKYILFSSCAWYWVIFAAILFGNFIAVIEDDYCDEDDYSECEKCVACPLCVKGCYKLNVHHLKSFFDYETSAPISSLNLLIIGICWVFIPSFRSVYMGRVLDFPEIKLVPDTLSDGRLASSLSYRYTANIGISNKYTSSYKYTFEFPKRGIFTQYALSQLDKGVYVENNVWKLAFGIVFLIAYFIWMLCGICIFIDANNSRYTDMGLYNPILLYCDFNTSWNQIPSTFSELGNKISPFFTS